MVLALVVAAAALPSNVAPAFWCAQAFVGVGSLRPKNRPLFGSDNLPKVGSIVAKLLFGTYELENKES